MLTPCSGIDYQGHNFKALAYRFMENGKLDEWLHPTSRMDEAVEEPKNLSLLQRFNIAIDVANALDYLHHCQTPIVHCNLKPSNILIDDEMIGHVDDFGLAKFLFDVIEDYSIVIKLRWSSRNCWLYSSRLISLSLSLSYIEFPFPFVIC